MIEKFSLLSKSTCGCFFWGNMFDKVLLEVYGHLTRLFNYTRKRLLLGFAKFDQRESSFFIEIPTLHKK